MFAERAHGKPAAKRSVDMLMNRRSLGAALGHCPGSRLVARPLPDAGLPAPRVLGCSVCVDSVGFRRPLPKPIPDAETGGSLLSLRVCGAQETRLRDRSLQCPPQSLTAIARRSTNRQHDSPCPWLSLHLHPGLHYPAGSTPIELQLSTPPHRRAHLHINLALSFAALQCPSRSALS